MRAWNDVGPGQWSEELLVVTSGDEIVCSISLHHYASILYVNHYVTSS